MKELIIKDNLPLIVDRVSRIPDGVEKIIFGNKFDRSLIINGLNGLPDNL